MWKPSERSFKEDPSKMSKVLTEKPTRLERLTNMNKPVPMKLFAAWEVDRTPSDCIPRWVNLTAIFVFLFVKCDCLALYLLANCTKCAKKKPITQMLTCTIISGVSNRNCISSSVCESYEYTHMFSIWNRLCRKWIQMNLGNWPESNGRDFDNENITNQRNVDTLNVHLHECVCVRLRFVLARSCMNTIMAIR